MRREQRSSEIPTGCVVVNFVGRKGAGAAIAYEMTRSLVDQGRRIAAIVPLQIENKALWEQLDLEKLILVDSYVDRASFLPKTLAFLFSGLRRVARELKGTQVTSVYCPMIQPWTPIINLMFRNVQRVVTLHDPVPHRGDSWMLDVLGRITVAGATDVVVLSREFREITAERYNVSPMNVHVIPHGDFKYYRDTLVPRELRMYDPSVSNFLFFGRFTEYKGLEVLAAAYGKICRKLNCSLTLAGSGDFSPYLTRFRDLPNVHLINRWFEDEEVGNLFCGENIILVLPYTEATQSGVIPIAIEFGVPIIASDTGGLGEQINSESTGILVRPGDADALGAAMLRTAGDSNLRSSLVAAAKRQNQRNSMNDISKLLLEVIDPPGNEPTAE